MTTVEVTGEGEVEVAVGVTDEALDLTEEEAAWMELIWPKNKFGLRNVKPKGLAHIIGRIVALEAKLQP